MRTLDLDALEIFRTVVREGGVVRAAARLHRVQSSVTTRIQQLETRLGVHLFKRQGRALVLTPSGQALLVHAERLLRLAQEAEAEIRTAPVRRLLRLGSMESTAGSRLPDVLARFHRQHPEIAIELQTGTTAAMARKVLDHELDAAFVGEPFPATGLQARPVYDEELVLVTSLSQPSPAGADAFETASILAFAQGCSYRQRLEAWLAQQGIRPQRLLELASYQAIIACVAAGTGWAIVPLSLLETVRTAQAVRQHPLPAALRHNRTHVVWKGPPAAALQAFLDAI